MKPTAITPILNVSDFEQSVAWFKALGWENGFRWGEPTTTFGAVNAGDVRIFLCVDGQGGCGKGNNTTTFSSPTDQSADKGTWMSVWVDNVDDIHTVCVENNIDITHAPETMPWGVKEMHIRHPDGHVFRITEQVA